MNSLTSNSELRAGDKTSGVHLWLVLWKAFRSVEAHAERSIAELKMCQSDFGVLEALFHKGPLAIKDLAAKVLLTSGSMTTAIDRLEARGLVQRDSDKQDRRSRIVRLTESGQETIHAAFTEHTAAMEETVSGLAPDERSVLIDLLRRLGLDAQQQLIADRTIGDGKRRKEKA
jgi:MarR family 2-MHQ and catechol resistance regulon transcriptional repressor